MKVYAWLFLAVFVLTEAVGCGGAADTAEPPDIAYGQDVCDRCNMIISEERYAAAYWTEAGEARRFDDIGGMVAYLREKSEEVASFWVHDYHTAEWIRAEGASYLLDTTMMTPMGFGIAAFTSGEAAQAMAAARDETQVLSFEQLLEMEMRMPSAHSHHMDDADHG